MAIETICKGCARKLRVGDEFAGRKARCPHCKTIFTVPESGAGIDDSSEPVIGTSGQWLLRANDGTNYGPVSKSELDNWVRDGRLDAGSHIKQADEETWRPASDLYPSLTRTFASNASPFASDPVFSDQADNPYVSPSAVGPPFRQYRPHRGGLILTLSLVAFVCCQFLSIAAWVMGHADMKEINAGRMDPAGRGLTQAGMIIGIIGTVLIIVTIGFQIIMVAVAVVGNA